MSQIIPSFTLARLIRENLPQIRIVFGGQVFNRLADRVLCLPKLFHYVDFFVLNEGETALLSLLKHLVGEIALRDVPNLIYYDRASQAAVRSSHRHVEDVPSLPTPDFSDLDLKRYLSPAPVLPYQPVRGCYWSRCTFCNQFAVHQPGARAKAPEEVVSELTLLRDEYGARHFTLVNESIHPSLLRRYSEAMVAAELDLHWYVGARFEAALDSECLRSMKRSGCKKLFLGLESGSERVLKDMRKGVSPRQAQRILKTCTDIDLAVHLFIMLGFPTETRQELEVSKRVIQELVAEAPTKGFTYYISVFQLKPCTHVFEHPDRYGIRQICRSHNSPDLGYLYSFDAERHGSIDYGQELRELEKLLDQKFKDSSYPENAVHYLAMGEAFGQRDQGRIPVREMGVGEANQSELFMVRPGLGLGRSHSWKLPPDASQEQATVVYDLLYDEWYRLDSEAAWQTLKDLTGEFSLNTLRNHIARHLLDGHSGREAERQGAELVECCLVVRVP